MSENVLMWFEIVFNVTYLAVIWVFTALMFSRLPRIEAGSRASLRLIVWGFFLLALGDTGHVGFRVVAYAMGGLEQVVVPGSRITLAGIGSLSTAYTVTILYILLAIYWRRRVGRTTAGTVTYWTVQTLLVLRLILMLFPQNDWGSVTPPALWGIVRNIPLTVAGVSIGILYLASRHEGSGEPKPLFTRLGVYILLSYAFYLPVILFVRRVPQLGMLMIPKTVMYLLMAGDCYRTLFLKKQSEI